MFRVECGCLNGRSWTWGVRIHGSSRSLWLILYLYPIVCLKNPVRPSCRFDFTWQELPFDMHDDELSTDQKFSALRQARVDRCRVVSRCSLRKEELGSAGWDLQFQACTYIADSCGSPAFWHASRLEFDCITNVQEFVQVSIISMKLFSKGVFLKFTIHIYKNQEQSKAMTIYAYYSRST